MYRKQQDPLKGANMIFRLIHDILLSNHIFNNRGCIVGMDAAFTSVKLAKVILHSHAHAFDIVHARSVCLLTYMFTVVYTSRLSTRVELVVSAPSTPNVPLKMLVQTPGITNNSNKVIKGFCLEGGTVSLTSRCRLGGG